MRPVRPSADPLGGPAHRSEDIDDAIQGDDRHLVAVDDNYGGGDMEDRLWLFWQRHSKSVLAALTIVALGLIGWEGWNAYQNHVVSTLQSEYQTLQTPDAFLNFAQANPNAILGKIALLEAADGFYTTGKYQEAAEAYGKAATVWGADEKGQRARLGWSLALLNSGDVAGAEQHLDSLYNDSTTLDYFRSQAAFDSAVIYAQHGDTANATTWVDRAKSFSSSPMWSSLAKTFGDIMPLLSDIKLVPAAAPAMDSAKLPETTVKSPAPAPAAAPKPPAASSTAPAATGFDLSGLPAKGTSP
ncbi:MAG TPA: tetratricopeptide repeat protein [Opitutales bacterium]|nr:tetratricopeptide repeat protein [Opitutales bacterium]